MTVAAASDTPRLTRAQNASSPEPPCKAVWFPYRTAWWSRGADLSPPKFDPHASSASAAPPPVDPLGVGVPHPYPFRCLLPKHNLLTEGGHGPSPSLARQQCLDDRRRREVPLNFHDEVAARPCPGRTVFQHVLRRIHARIAVVATRGRLFSDSVQVFTKAPVPGKHLSHPVSQGGAAPSNQTSQFGKTASRTLSPGAAAIVEVGATTVEQGPSSPTFNVGAHRVDAVRQTPNVEVNLASPQCLQFERGKPGEHRRCCRHNGAEASQYLDGHRPVQPSATAAAGHQVLHPDRCSIEEPRSHHTGEQPTHSEAGPAQPRQQTS